MDNTIQDILTAFNSLTDTQKEQALRLAREIVQESAKNADD